MYTLTHTSIWCRCRQKYEWQIKSAFMLILFRVNVCVFFFFSWLHQIDSMAIDTTCFVNSCIVRLIQVQESKGKKAYLKSFLGCFLHLSFVCWAHKNTSTSPCLFSHVSVNFMCLCTVCCVFFPLRDLFSRFLVPTSDVFTPKEEEEEAKEEIEQLLQKNPKQMGRHW